MKNIESMTEMDPIHLEILKDSEHSAIFINEDEYQVLVLRGLAITTEGLIFVPTAVVINNSKEIFVYDKKKNVLTKSNVTYNTLCDFFRPIYQKNEKIIDQFVEEIDQLEDSLFERKAPRIFMDIWFDLKKDLSRIERLFVRGHLVLQDFYKANLKNEQFEDTEFQDLIHEVGVDLQHINTQLSRLDALYSYYGSIKNDKLNYNIYMLTVLSAVFLPLNLIVGFFGMNTENLYFNGNPLGTQYVLGIIVGSIVLTFFGFPLVRFIDNHFLRFFLGRYDIYKKISNKVDKLESILREL